MWSTFLSGKKKKDEKKKRNAILELGAHVQKIEEDKPRCPYLSLQRWRTVDAVRCRPRQD